MSTVTIFPDTFTVELPDAKYDGLDAIWDALKPLVLEKMKTMSAEEVSFDFEFSDPADE